MTTYNINNPGSASCIIPTGLKTNDILVFNNTSTGYLGNILTWTVPWSGYYDIETLGAKGGSGDSSGGNGARMKGRFLLQAGTVIKILVGQLGGNDSAGGGGGGTFVVKSDNTPLIIAGGGGGGSVYIGLYASMYGSITNNGNSSSSNSNPGGSSGNGGGSRNQHSGGGGGGFNSNGENISPSTYWGQGGYSFKNGGAGGQIYYTYNSGVGGFGGGGRSGHNGGGGGGYSGGGAGYHSNQASGGGGSYNIGTDQSNTANYNAGHGKVNITLLIPEVTYINNVISTVSDLIPISKPFNISATLGYSNTNFKYRITVDSDIVVDNEIENYNTVDINDNIDISILQDGLHKITINGDITVYQFSDEKVYSYYIFKFKGTYRVASKCCICKNIILPELINAIFLETNSLGKTEYAISNDDGISWFPYVNLTVLSVPSTKSIKLSCLMDTTSELKAYSILFIPEVI